MINNRQSGRRRGRGGQRPQGMPGNSGGNQRDNRNRGNAAQLLEKYKSLARDAQLAGDRVQTEYYLQFADHYFRVLEENRARFEDQQPRRRRDEDEDGDDEGDLIEADGGDGDERAERADREDREDRAERQPRRRGRERDDRRDRANGYDREPASEPAERIDMAVLPPAIGADESASEGEEEIARPRRRRLKPRDDGGEGASAA